MKRIRSLGFLVIVIASLSVAAAFGFGDLEQADAKSAPPSKPYRRKSLGNLSDAELIRYMGDGRNAFDFKDESVIRNHVPPNFWTMEPKQAALAVVESNRGKMHRARFALTLDTGDGKGPPASCTLAVSESSSRCYNAIDGFYFLRVDPKASYLAYARSWSGGAVFYSAVFDQPAFDLRFCPLSYADARHMAETIWWLDRVRSRKIVDDFEGSRMFSTGDGSGTLTFRDVEDTVLVDRSETLWSSQLSERWTGDFDREAYVNFATYLVTEVLTERLGKAWTEASPTNDQNNYLRQDHGPLYTEAELGRFRELTARFLGWFSSKQDRLSNAIVGCAAEAAGTLVMPETKAELERIQTVLPGDAKPMRRYQEVSDERSTTANVVANDPESRAAREKKLQELDAEMDAIHQASRADSPVLLREMVTIALRKINTADDPVALYGWAITDEAGFQWAMQRLSHIDQPRYVNALEWRMNHDEDRWSRQFFDEINRVAPARAAEIAANLPSGKREALAVSAFSLLQKTERLIDEKKRLATLLAILRNSKSGWDERDKAIDLLVPPNAPFRYPQREVDDALVRVLAPDMADDGLNLTLAKSCRALALRKRGEVFDLMAELLGADKNASLYDDILGALVLLAQSDPAQFNPKLEALIASHLKRTNKRMTEIFWAIWAADLRGFESKLARLGTSGPDDYEDEKAVVSGGSVSPVRGRFHQARKIADVWNARDAVTRIRLLTALALTARFSFDEESHPERIARLKMSLGKAATELTPQQRQRLHGFCDTIMALPNRADLPDTEGREKIVSWVAAAIDAH
jgi:hypothetical protein